MVAKGVTRMFIHKLDSLVTRDYLDTRFTGFETRIEAKVDRRFAAVDVRFERMQGSTLFPYTTLFRSRKSVV